MMNDSITVKEALELRKQIIKGLQSEVDAALQLIEKSTGLSAKISIEHFQVTTMSDSKPVYKHSVHIQVEL